MDPFEFPPLRLDTESEKSRCSKSTAGILGVLLGAFGVHRLYLGYRWLSALQLTLTLLTAGLAGLWGTFEGLMILSGRFRRDALGKPLRSARRAYSPAAYPRLALTQYQHSRSSPWLMTLMIFFFPLSNSLVLASIWTLAGWSLPGMLTGPPDLIPPPGGEYWVANDQPVALVVEVIVPDDLKREKLNEPPRLVLEMVDLNWNEEGSLPVAVPWQSEAPATSRFESHSEEQWSRSSAADAAVPLKIAPQRMARVEAAAASGHRLPKVLETSGDNPRPLSAPARRVREFPQTQPARPIPQESVRGGSIRTPGVILQPLVRPVYNPSPEYPPQALAQHRQGVVKIRVRIAADGTVLTTRVVQTSNHRSLDAAALKAVQRWRFAISSQEPVQQPVEVIVPIRFRIELP